MKTRTEKDSLGTIELPADALYGAQTARAIRNFPISGLRAHPALIRAIAAIKMAAAEANRDLGTVTAERANAIMAAAKEILGGKHHDQFVVDVFQAGAGVSFHMNTNEVIANRANQILGAKLGSYEKVHPNDHVNYGQSTNDVFPTAMRLSALLALEDLYPVLKSLSASFAKKAEEFDHVLKSGRTHMQDATPIRLGQEFAAYGLAIAHACRTISRTSASLRELGLGGSAVGTGLNTHPQYRALAIQNLSTLTKQPLCPAPDMRYAMQSCAPMADLSGSLRTLALEVIRISNDLRLLSSGPNTGLNEIQLPALQPGSSIMPGKVNPVLAELAAMVAFQVIGNDTAIGYAVQAGQLELNVMMPTITYNTLQSIQILTNTLREFNERCIAGITANEDRCAFYAESTVSLATALNPYIGYAKAAELVKESIASGKGILSLAREKELLTDEQITEILDPQKMTEPRETI
jgi:aspartate ammonia-lyase